MSRTATHFGRHLPATEDHKQFKGKSLQLCYACQILKWFKTLICLKQVVLKKHYPFQLIGKLSVWLRWPQ